MPNSSYGSEFDAPGATPDGDLETQLMDTFDFTNGSLCCDSHSLSDIADQFGTPVYVYSARAFREHYAALRDAFAAIEPRLCFSIKSCHNVHILRTLLECGSSFDAVSIGEVRRALEAGAKASDIVFAGVGKTPAEIEAAVDLGVGTFNAESAAELDVIAAVANKARKNVRAALRINPDVDAKTHPHTTTGKDENKFGIEIGSSPALFQKHKDDPYLSLVGIHLHIGSPVNTVAPYVEMVTKALELVVKLKADGVNIDSINIGGGYGAEYGHQSSATPREYADAIVPLLKDSGLKVSLEPGRSISANAGILITRVVYLKESRTKQFVIVDGSMTDLIRPALYDAYHFIWPVSPAGGVAPSDRSPAYRIEGARPVDIVGPVCESSDYLGRNRFIPAVKQGDLLAVFSAGAYGAVMGSQYNTRCRAAEVLVESDGPRLIRRRETFDDIMACERNL
ncbi:MAG TPA: diaminopimelate decarboxylase [Phycisphaerae bacterium]|nr:diaminopimelate decarboxylase [Phycisphaerae bacterium]